MPCVEALPTLKGLRSVLRRAMIPPVMSPVPCRALRDLKPLELGDRTFEAGRLQEARIWYRRVLTLDRKQSHAQQRLRQVEQSLAM